ncbi:hypothetical protein ABT57_09780 [Photobacterium ganghwense]|uniref:Uncharacterized protein n=1 Tax=Photobacterium ganghwense TaxID=320778 RepID=A0A0J1HE82_9GAMM|nr:hypothetical protein ABT57_09780 [Photobacterium ganghwense]
MPASFVQAEVMLLVYPVKKAILAIFGTERYSVDNHFQQRNTGSFCVVIFGARTIQMLAPSI